MPTPIRITAQVTVDAEPARVWRAGVDWPRQRERVWANRATGRGLQSSLRRFARLFSRT